MEKCKHKGSMKLRDMEWEWCHFFNAKAGDVDCGTCPIKNEFEAPSIVLQATA